MLSLRIVPMSVWAVCAAGCFPELPACDDDCLATTGDATQGDATDDGRTSSGTAPTSDDADSTANAAGSSGGEETDTGGDSSDDDTGSDGPPACTRALSELSWQRTTAEVTSEKYSAGLPVGDESAAYLVDHCGSDANLLYFSPNTIERGMAVTAYPSWNSWNSAFTIDTVEVGAAVVTLRAEWTVNVGNDGVIEATGHSDYTYLADGRIIRDEYIDYASSTEPSENWWLVGFASFDIEAFTLVEGRGGNFDFDHAIEPNRALDYGQQLGTAGPDQVATYCARGRTDAVGFTGMDANTPLDSTEWSGLRATEQASGGDRSIAFQADWARGGVPTSPIALGEYRGHFQTTLATDGLGQCDRLHDQGQAFRTPPNLIPRGAGGAYDGFDPGRAAYRLTIAPDVALDLGVTGTLHTTLLDVDDQGVGIHDVLVDGTSLQSWEYIVQRSLVNPQRVFVLVGVPLQNTTTLTVVTEAG